MRDKHAQRFAGSWNIGRELCSEASVGRPILTVLSLAHVPCPPAVPQSMVEAWKPEFGGDPGRYKVAYHDHVTSLHYHLMARSQRHPVAMARAWQTSAILSGPSCPTRRRSRDVSTV
jgi:hypothetical protein